MVAWSACASLAGAIFVVVQPANAIEASSPSAYADDCILPLSCLWPARFCSREAFCKEFSNPVLRVIKRAPWPSASYEPGMTTLFDELDVERGVASGRVANIVQHF